MSRDAPRLGRGLASLLGAPDADQQSSVRTIAIEFLEPGPFQPRADMKPGALDELAASIKARGVLQPLLARPHPGQPGRFQIIAGERRWRASQLAGLHELPILVRSLSDSDALAAALVENLQRQDLDPVEEAEGYRRLLEEFGLTQEQLAEAVGKSRAHVANTMRLLALPAEVLEHLRRSMITAGHARALLSMKDPVAMMRIVIGRGLNVRQTEALAKAPEENLNAGASRDRAEKDPDTRAVEQQLMGHLGLKVDIAARGKGGTLRISYGNLDQLDGLIALLTQ